MSRSKGLVRTLICQAIFLWGTNHSKKHIFCIIVKRSLIIVTLSSIPDTSMLFRPCAHTSCVISPPRSSQTRMSASVARFWRTWSRSYSRCLIFVHYVFSWLIDILPINNKDIKDAKWKLKKLTVIGIQFFFKILLYRLSFMNKLFIHLRHYCFYFNAMFFCRNLTPTKIQSQSLWSACMWILTLTVLRRNWGSVNRWVASQTLISTSWCLLFFLQTGLLTSSSFWVSLSSFSMQCSKHYKDVIRVTLFLTQLFCVGPAQTQQWQPVHCVIFSNLELLSVIVWLRLLSEFTMACNWPIRVAVNSKSFISKCLLRGVQTLVNCRAGQVAKNIQNNSFQIDYYWSFIWYTVGIKPEIWSPV